MSSRLHAFYCSKAWRDLSYSQKVARGGKCERCGFVAVTRDDWAMLIGHHRIELRENNVSDAGISLNPDNVEIICQRCHNQEHRRFGSKKQVYLVWGSPLSGKSTAVHDMMQRGDILLDIDRIWSALTGQPEYDKPDNVRFNIFAVRETVLNQIKTRYGNWHDAYIVGGYPNKYERDRVARELGATAIYCESSREECLRRRAESGRPEAWDTYINDWWDEYERTN